MSIAFQLNLFCIFPKQEIHSYTVKQSWVIIPARNDYYNFKWECTKTHIGTPNFNPYKTPPNMLNHKVPGMHHHYSHRKLEVWNSVSVKKWVFSYSLNVFANTWAFSREVGNPISQNLENYGLLKEKFN